MENNCYVTLMTEIRFLPCIIRCNQGMKHFKSKYPYIVLIPENNAYFEQEVIKNNLLYKKIPLDNFKNKHDYFNDTINKFHIFNFLEYDKICFLDGDIIISGNIDEEFDYMKDNVNIIKYVYREKETINANVTGQMFIIRPQNGVYEDLKKHSYFFQNDEELIVNHNYIRNNMYDYKYSLLNQYLDKYQIRKIPFHVIHFGGKIKVWEKHLEGFNDLKAFFYDLTEEEALDILANKGFQNYYKGSRLLYHFYNKIFLRTFVIFAQTQEDINKGIEIHKKLLYYSTLYPLTFIIENNQNFIHQLDQLDIPYFISEKPIDKLKLVEKIYLLDKFFQENCASICLIDNLDIQIIENLNYILEQKVSDIFLQDMLLIKYKELY